MASEYAPKRQETAPDQSVLAEGLNLQDCDNIVNYEQMVRGVKDLRKIADGYARYIASRG